MAKLTKLNLLLLPLVLLLSLLRCLHQWPRLLKIRLLLLT